MAWSVGSAKLVPGARSYLERVLAAPQVWEVPLADARRGFEEEALELWGDLDAVAEIVDR